MNSTSPNALLNEIRAEFLKSVRSPEFVFPTIALPVFLYAVFGIVILGAGAYSTYLVATYGVFAVMGPALFGFGAYIAVERERGWLDVKRASPISGITFICAKLSATIICAAVALVLIYLFAALWGDVRFNPLTWIILLATHLCGVLPFAFIGIALGFALKANGAIAICNVLFISFALLGGLWMPLDSFPEFMQYLARILPSYHLAEISLFVIGARDSVSAVLGNIFAITALTVIFAGVALLAWRRQLD